MSYLLFSLLLLISIPGILAILPLSLRLSEKKFAEKGKVDFLNKRALAVLIFYQSLILNGLCILSGCMLADNAGLTAPFFYSIVGINITEAPLQILMNTLSASGMYILGGAVIFLALYYALRKTIEVDNLQKLEKTRVDAGYLGRVFYGGINEELMCRWGLMPLFTVLFMLFFDNAIAIWMSIGLSSILFTLLHVPGLKIANCEFSARFISFIVFFNVAVGVLCGYLFWQYGIMAAIMLHMLIHILWHPIDRFLIKA